MTRASSEAPGSDGLGLAKTLLRTVRAGALATLDRSNGFPFASLVTVATDPDGSPLLLLSRLAVHTANLDADPRASLLLAEAGKGDPLAHARLTVTGRLHPTAEPRARARFLARHAKASLSAGLADFSFWRMEILAGHLVGGFGRIMGVTAEGLGTALAGAEELLEAEASAVEHLNAEHRDALRLYATRLAGAPEADWRASGIDPEGLDLVAGDRTARLGFPERVTRPEGLRRLLKELADRARQAPRRGPVGPAAGEGAEQPSG